MSHIKTIPEAGLTPSERALREAAEKATKSRWSVSDDPDLPGAVVVDGDGYMLADCNIFLPGSQWQRSDAGNLANAAYIVAAQPRAVLALLDEIERLRKAASLVEFWFAPWGAYKSAKWEELSGDRPFTAEVMLDLVRAALAEKEP